MTRFLFLLSVVFAAVTAAPFVDSLLPILDRKTVTTIADIKGTFKIDADRSDLFCPDRIVYAGVGEGSTQIPHSDITVDGESCKDGQTKLFTNVKEAKNNGDFEKNVIKILNNDFAPANIQAVYGVDSSGLSCGEPKSVVFNPNTLSVFITVIESKTKIGDNFYNPGMRYVVVYDGTTVCRYDTKLLPTSSPSPSTSTVAVTSTTPSESTSPMVSASPELPTPTTDPSTSVSPNVSPSVTISATPTPTLGDAIPDPTESVEPEDGEPSETPDDGSVCFPADAQVTLEDGTTKTMSAVEVGDRVLVSGGLFSEVYMFTHKQQHTKHEFVSITTHSGAVLEATKSHYIYVNGRFAAASTARVGDTLELGNGARSAIVSVSRVTKMGLYNPQTVHGDIVVNSIRASTFTRTVEPATAQALLMPLRAAYAALGWTTSAFNNGADNIAALLPRGQTAL